MSSRRAGEVDKEVGLVSIGMVGYQYLLSLWMHWPGRSFSMMIACHNSCLHSNLVESKLEWPTVHAIVWLVLQHDDNIDTSPATCTGPAGINEGVFSLVVSQVTGNCVGSRWWDALEGAVLLWHH